MSKADRLLQEIDETLRTGTEVEGSLKQYTDHGDVKKATIKTQEQLEPGVYYPQETMAGLIFKKHNYATDELVRYEDCTYNWMMEEINNFWEMKDRFHSLGYTHKRGYLMQGPPGTGKSCIIKMLMEDIVEKGDVVFVCKEISSLVNGLKEFRQVEPDRQAFVVIEDIDGVIQWAERQILELFDGDDQVDGVCYIATTNYPERLPERIRRVGRFDKEVTVNFPTAEGRLAYLNHKIGTHESDGVIQEMVDSTDGFGFNHLKELIIGMFCLGQGLEETVTQIRGGKNYNGNQISESVLTSMIENPQKTDESKASSFLAEFAGYTFGSFEDSQDIKQAFKAHFDAYGFEGVDVQDVIVEEDGDIIVTFVDDENDSMDVIFAIDKQDDSMFAILLDDNAEASEEEDEIMVIDIDFAGAVPRTNQFGSQSVDLVDLSWMNKSTLETILTQGEIGAKIDFQGDEPVATGMSDQDAIASLPQVAIPFADQKEDEFGHRVLTVMQGEALVKVDVEGMEFEILTTRDSVKRINNQDDKIIKKMVKDGLLKNRKGTMASKSHDSFKITPKFKKAYMENVGSEFSEAFRKAVSYTHLTLPTKA